MALRTLLARFSPAQTKGCKATCASRCARDLYMVLCAGGSPYTQLDDGLGPG